MAKSNNKTYKKTIILILVVAVVLGGAYYLNFSNPELFRGLIVQDQPVPPEVAEREAELGLKADLKADIEVLPPDEGSQDIIAVATIENAGDGSVLGNIPFIYTIYINDQEVFSNIDSYTTMDPGDAFSFNYPISRAIYQYEDSGIVRFKIDTEDSIDEKDERNNTAQVEYSF